MILDNIDSPHDLKTLNRSELQLLCNEIRSVLINKLSLCGGHLGPNLGFVECTVALHYIFNSPIDKIVFDVSHQCYTHKILTGRKDAFLNKDNFKSVTGYTEPRESKHDMFTVGHTSTSISMACGMAKARDIIGNNENIIAVIGDGSLSGGEAYEGLNCAAKLNSNFIIILNDNCQSISDVNGSLYNHLKELRDSKGSSSNNIFKALGYDYLYIEDGNNIYSLLDVFSKIKDINHPVVVHLHTIKGKGYSYAEKNREDWHWYPPFYIENGMKRRPMIGENYDDLVGEYLLHKMKSNPTILTMCAAVPATIGFDKVRREAAGKQFIDVDICEEHLISMAAGVAKNGGTPVVATFSTFFQRAYDQISQDICINNLPVTLLIRNGTVWAGNDVTHIGWFDMSLFANIPNFVFLCPTNCEEYFAMLDWSIEQKEHPVGIRIPRNGVYHTNKKVEKDYSCLNKAIIEQTGSKIAIIAVGDFFQIGEALSEAISSELGITPTLINPRFVSGLDEKLLTNLKDTHSILISLEDGILDGGYGQKIASFYGNSNMRVLNYGLRKEFLDGYNATEVLSNYGITIENILKEISLIDK